MRSELDYYFEKSPKFIERLLRLNEFEDSGEKTIAIINFARQFDLLDSHIPVLVHYLNTKEYDPDLIKDSIELVDYSRGLTLNSNNPRKDFKSFVDGQPLHGVHLIVDGDVTADKIKEFIEKNASLITEAIDKSGQKRIKRFVAKPNMNKYITMADEYYFNEGGQKTQESIANKYNMSYPMASRWIKKLKPILPPK